jgi:hypothetical protein
MVGTGGCHLAATVGRFIFSRAESVLASELVIKLRPVHRFSSFSDLIRLNSGCEELGDRCIAMNYLIQVDEPTGSI